MMKKITKPRGTQDILPEDQKYWDFVLKSFTKSVIQQGFEKIETPIFEKSTIFTRPLGETSDVVEKEMFQVKRLSQENQSISPEKKDISQLVLRPENTAPIIRSYLEGNLGNLPQPLKLYYIGPMFRYDRPQRGRLRQFTQAGFEIIGDGSPATDALTIFLVYQILRKLKLTKYIRLDLNALGCKVCQPNIRKNIYDYLKNFKSHLCPDCQRRLEINPFRILDCKKEKCQTIARSAPNLVDLSCDACKKHFRETLEYLDILRLPYNLKPNLVRGLDYYTRTTFELSLKDDAGQQNALAGGGRYDRLAEMLGGNATPAIGVSFGLERIIDALKKYQITVPDLPQPEIILIQLGKKARQKTLEIMPDLLAKGFRLFSAPGKESLKAQLRLANKKNIRLAIIVGEKEVFQNTVILKDLVKNSQESITLGRLPRRLRTLLKQKK